jgi:hypothetical protein
MAPISTRSAPTKIFLDAQCEHAQDALSIYPITIRCRIADAYVRFE